MKFFISTHRIREDAIPTWMGATTKAEHEGIEFLGLVPEGKLPNVTKAKRSHRYANGIRNKGINGADLVLSKLPATRDEITDAFVNEGFSKSSTGPTISHLISAGMVERGRDRIFRKKA